MRILLIESEHTFAELVVETIKKHYPERPSEEKSLTILATNDLSEAMGLMVLTGMKFDLVICAETVNSSDGDSDVGNGLRYMTEDCLTVERILLANSEIKRVFGIKAIPRDFDSISKQLPEIFREVLIRNDVTIN